MDRKMKQEKWLKRNNWAPHTWKALDRLIRYNGVHSAQYDASAPPYAVFDCDNTTVINDLEETLLAYQIQNLYFTIPPQEMEKVLMTGIPDAQQPFPENYRNKDGSLLTAERLIQDCTMDYLELYQMYAGFGAGGTKSLQETQQTGAFLDFRAKLRLLYDGITETFHAAVGYPWITYLFYGMTSEQLRSLAAESNRFWMSKPFRWETWTSPAARKGHAGIVSVHIRTGLAFPPEMQDLYQTLQANGIVVYVCSASAQEVVAAALCGQEFGCREEQIYGMRLQKDHQGRLQNACAEHYPKTEGAGKVQTIDNFIRTRHGGSGPILVAGDSAGDVPMLMAYPDMQLGLLINRVRSGSLSPLVQQAVKQTGRADARYVLQGRDENSGQFRSSEKSILLGESEEQLMR